MNKAEQKSIPELTASYELLQKRVRALQDQIELAKAEQISTGKYAAPVWFAKTNAALRTKRAEAQKMMILIAEAKKSDRISRNKSISEVFVEEARSYLEPSIFELLLTRALDRVPSRSE